MMNAQEIIAYIGSAEKKTPVKVYIKERQIGRASCRERVSSPV